MKADIIYVSLNIAINDDTYPVSWSGSKSHDAVTGTVERRV